MWLANRKKMRTPFHETVQRPPGENQQQSGQLELRLRADCSIGCDRHSVQQVEELLALADEEAAGREGIHGSHGACKFIRERTNHRDLRKIAPEYNRDGEDQTGLSLLLEWFEKIRE